MDSRMLLKDTDVARALGYSRQTTRNLMDAGALPVVQFGKTRRIPREALQTFVRELSAGLTVQEIAARRKAERAALLGAATSSAA